MKGNCCSRDSVGYLTSAMRSFTEEVSTESRAEITHHAGAGGSVNHRYPHDSLTSSHLPSENLWLTANCSGNCCVLCLLPSSAGDVGPTAGGEQGKEEKWMGLRGPFLGNWQLSVTWSNGPWVDSAFSPGTKTTHEPKDVSRRARGIAYPVWIAEGFCLSLLVQHLHMALGSWSRSQNPAVTMTTY